MEASAEGVEVHVRVPGHTAAAKHPSDPNSPTNINSTQQNSAVASIEPTNSISTHYDACWSRSLWTLFVLGWVFPPFWWAAAAAGFKLGRDRQCLLLQRKGLSPAQKAAWHASLIMSMFSAVVIIMVLSIYYGQLSAEHAPAQEGPFYMTLAGPSDAFPDLTNSANKHLLAAAVHSALNLDSGYPVSNMVLWVQEVAYNSANSPARRRVFDAATAQLMVLGYSLIISPSLPPKMQLQMIMADADATNRLAQRLAENGFLPSEDLGRLSVGLTSWGDSGAVVQQLTSGAGQGAWNIHLIPIGRRNCQGAWSAWSDCMPFDSADQCGPGNQTRNFTVTVAAAAGGADCSAEHGVVEVQACNTTTPCNATQQDCQGNWSAWSDCMPFDSADQCGPGNQTRNFTVTVAAAAGGADCSAEHGVVEVHACNMTTPCNATCSCGTGPRTPEALAYTLLPNTRMPGNDITNGNECYMIMPSVDACAQLCASTRFCRGFTYRSTNYSGNCAGGCFLKKLPPSSLWDPSDGTSVMATSGIMPVVVADATMLIDEDYAGNNVSLHNCPSSAFPGSDGRSYNVMDAEGCAAACATAPNCKAYSYVANGTNTVCPYACYLKDPVPALVNGSGIVTGVVAGTRATFSHLVNTDFATSTNINSTEACAFPPSGSLDKCATLCIDTPGCIAFVYAPNSPDSDGSTRCVLKSAAEGRVVRASAVAAMLLPTGSIGYNVSCLGDSVWNSTTGACVSNCTCASGR